MGPAAAQDAGGAGWRGKRVLVLSPTPTSPENYGNRRRIRRVCSDIKAAGGEITFVHYASELEWRDTLPAGAQAEMRAMWDEYHLIPPTVWLHSAPTGSHHEIDDWWDPSIETFLRWLLERTRFDVFIVNYTWLSRALLMAPPGVLRVLDTHDRFAGRKEILQAHGIVPEFFYLRDDAAETEALKRADVVWAIKEQEAEHFAGLISKPVITMPYMQAGAVLPRGAPDPDGVLRVGVVGAGNNINKVNIERFAQVFRRIARQYFAPVRLIIAGSVCEALDLQEDQQIALMGRVEAIEDFYGVIDVVAIPMEFSTGLKVKAGEALSFGLPVISTAHGFEGYPTREHLHLLPDLTAVAKAAVRLSFEPERLAGLANASLAVTARSLSAVAGGLESTAREADGQFRGLFVVDGAMLDDRSEAAEAILGLLGFVSYVGATEVFVAGGPLEPGQVLDRILSHVGRVTVDSSVVLDASLAAGRAGLRTATLEDVLAQSRFTIAVLDTLLTPDQLAAARAARTVWMVRPALMALGGGGDLQQQLEELAPASLLVPRHSVWSHAAARRAGARVTVCPLFGRTVRMPARARASRGYVRPDILILSRRDEARAALLQAAFADLGWRALITEAAAAPVDTPRDTPVSPGWIMRQIAGGGAPPPVAIDLTRADFGSMMLLEFLDRHHVPVLQDGGHPMAEARSWLRADQSGAGFWGLLKDADRLLRRYPETFGIDHRNRQRLEQEYASEAGWAAVWRFCTALKDEGGQGLAELGL